MQKLDVTVKRDQLKIGNVSVTFHRTLRIPDDGKQYPLPPSLGAFPLRRVEDFKEKVPAAWREHGGVFLPMYQREAMWLRFDAPAWRPNAIKVAIGKINALSGKPWSEKLAKGRDDAEDYMVVPDQPWIDGINAGNGFIKQFVAMPLGMGYTVEGQVTGEEKFGGVQICVFDPKSGKFPDARPLDRLRGKRFRGAGGQMTSSANWAGEVASASCYAPQNAAFLDSGIEAHGLGSLESLGPDLTGQEMGLGAGGRMKQKIYADRHGIETWDQETYGRVYVHLVNSAMWTAITGEAIPPTPVSAQTYAQHGYPWFDLYDEDATDVSPSAVFDGVKSVKEMDAEKGFEKQQDDSSFEVPEGQVTKYHPEKSGVPVKDGAW